MANMVTVKTINLVPGTDRDVYITWDWDKENTDHYELRVWYLLEGISGGWEATNGSNFTTKEKRYQYTAPSNATKVTISVKPVAKTHKVNNVDTAYWTADWSTQVGYYFKNNPPSKPNAPSVKLDKYTLTATLDPIPERTRHVIFMILDDTGERRMGTRPVTTNISVSCSYTVSAGKKYKVRCYVYNEDWEAGPASDYSQEIQTIPSAPARIETLKAKTSTSIYLDWSTVTVADTYDVEYATKKDYLGTVDKSRILTGIKTTYHEFVGLESGSEYFFRVRAVNEQGESEWCEAKSIIIGKAPSAPTTWSSTTTAVVGGALNLYWVHNTEDGSRQTYATIEIDDGSGSPELIEIDDRANDESEDEDDVTHYSIDTTKYSAGAKIRWRVKTKGVVPEWSEWSIQRTIDIYAPPTLQLTVTTASGGSVNNLTSFPMRVRGDARPNTQTPLGYHLSIIANESYQTTDRIGNRKIVNKGEVIYSRHFDISDDLDVIISAGDVNLDNNISYTVKCIVSMNSGLNAESTYDFTVAWVHDIYEPNAEIGIDYDTYSAYIRPYCVTSTGAIATDVTLAVYRREFDGKFTEIISGLENANDIFVTDPHPALDYARYRIVATSTITGTVSYYDAPAYPVGGKVAILQWDEEWSTFDATEAPSEQQLWSGSILKLFYNIDVSDKTQPDVALVEYAGREHPVGYYGTQLGQSSTWKMAIPKEDKETLYAIRRLAVWMGNVYVREPSGTGYWANVTVSYSQQHLDLTIPITLDISRVEGGV